MPFSIKISFCGGLQIILSAQHNFSFQIHDNHWDNTQLCCVLCEASRYQGSTFSKLAPLIAEL